MRLYISGPMAGKPNDNYNEFDTMAASLREAGHTVVSPAETSRVQFAMHGGRPAFEKQYDTEPKRRQFFMRVDVASLLEVEGVVILPYWWLSRGATFEILVALQMGLPIFAFWSETGLQEMSTDTWQAALKHFIVESRAAGNLVKVDEQVMVTEGKVMSNVHIGEGVSKKEAHLADIYDALGVKWGADPFAAIQQLQQKAFEAFVSGTHVGSASGVTKGDEQESIALEADRLVDGARQKDYGHPLDNYSKVAGLWNAYLNGIKPEQEGLDAENVIDMMALMKIGRLLNGAHRDSIVDIAGYAKCRDMCRTERSRRGSL